MNFTLQRIASEKDTVLGLLYHVPDFHFCTLEPWPAIKVGTYKLTRYDSPKNRGIVWLFHDVPGHTFIEIHVGNIKADTEGCILIGEEFGRIEGEPAVIHSRDAFRRFMELTKNQSRLTIEIRNPIINPKGG